MFSIESERLESGCIFVGCIECTGQHRFQLTVLLGIPRYNIYDGIRQLLISHSVIKQHVECVISSQGIFNHIFLYA